MRPRSCIWLVWLALAACGERSAPATIEAASGEDAAPVTAPALAADQGEAPPGYIAVIAPVEAVDVAPRVSGELLEVTVRAGDVVAAGDTVARLDPRRLREELAVARAALLSARATLRQAEVDIADAERLVATEERAVAAGTSAQSKLEEARFALQRAQAAKDHALAAVAEERARSVQAQSRLDDTVIKAPFAGTVATRYRDAGAAVGPAEPVLRLIGAGGLRVVFAAPPERVGALAVGQEVVVDIDIIAGERRAVIRQIAPELDPASRLFFVEAELARVEVDAEAGSEVRPGLAARVRPIEAE